MKGVDGMKFKLFLIAIAIAVCVLTAWFNVNVVWADEGQPTRTFYNNKVPYKNFFLTHNPSQVNVQVHRQGKVVQAVIPVVNDEKKDLTKEKKGN